ncbi:MAG TPA: hypothetical protein IAD14_09525 [Candidatus Coprousia avicola]|nr:hypothetical protein [Candidatus Coprousia avicola]
MSSLLQARWGDGWRTPNWELVFLLMSQGLFHAALEVRRALESRIEQEGSPFERFSLCMQRGRYGQAARLAQQDTFCDSLPAGEPLDRLAACIPSGGPAERGRAQAGRAPLAQSSTPELVKRVGGRKIAIRGPVRNGGGKQRPHDNGLFVVDFNHIDTAPAEGADVRGDANSHSDASPVECSVYSGAVAARFDAQPGDFADGRIYRVFKYGSSSPVREGFVRSGRGHQALWSRFSQLYSSPNLLQIALSDFIARGFAPIAVTDNNLYVHDVYKRGYSSRDVQARLSPFESRLRFAKHDPFANRDYLIGLYQGGLIEPDEVLGELLGMDDDEFASCMQREHGGQNEARVLAALERSMGSRKWNSNEVRQ